MDKKMIFIGSVYPESVLSTLPLLGSKIDFAAQTFQSALLEGLDKFYHDRTIITASPIDSYPKVKKVLFKRKLFSHNNHNDNGTDVFVGMVNLPLLKMLSKCIRISREIRRQTKDKNVEYIAVVYSCISPALLAFWLNRRRFKTSCLIVPDLPEFVSSNKNKLYLAAKKVEKWLTYPAYRAIDKYVLLSPYMKEKLPMQGKPFVVVEGIYRPTERDYEKSGMGGNSHFVILYTGWVSFRYGVRDLLRAFKYIESPNIELWLCGSCETVDRKDFDSFLRNDARIKYLGIMPHEDVLKMQQQVSLLINPRHSSDEFTNYSFPSKTMEYMASGTPVLMSKLGAIPEDYYPYLYFFDDESEKGMARKIEYIYSLNKSELESKGNKAREFILQKKNCYIQAQKIFDLIEKV